jgi:hypothetical protein
MIIKDNDKSIVIPEGVNSFTIEDGPLDDQVYFSYGSHNGVETFKIGAFNSKFKVLNLSNNSVEVIRRRYNKESCKRKEFSLRYTVGEMDNAEDEQDFEQERNSIQHIVQPLTFGTLVCYKEEGEPYCFIIYFHGLDRIKVNFNNRKPTLIGIEYGASLELN